MTYESHSVPLDRIDDTDDTYRITTRTVSDDLALSIELVGVVNQPILEKKKDRYILLSGFRRIDAVKRLQWESIESRILPGDLPFLNRAMIAVSENSLQRDLNLIETSRALNLLSRGLDDPKDLLKAAKALSLPGNPAVINKISQLVRLPLPVQLALLSETVGLSTALQLARMTEPASSRLVDIFENLKLGLNKQRELILITEEISKRDDMSICDMLSAPPIEAILTDDDLDRSQKARELRLYLKRIRFPELSRAQAQFETEKKSLKLDHHIKLQAPAYFEGQDFYFNIKFNTLDEFQKRLNALNRLLNHPSFIRILS